MFKIKFGVCLFLVFIGLKIKAQGSILVVSENESFSVTINNIAIHNVHKNIMMRSNDSLLAKVEITVEEVLIKKTFQLTAGDYAYLLQKNTRGIYKLRLRSKLALPSNLKTVLLAEYPFPTNLEEESENSFDMDSVLYHLENQAFEFERQKNIQSALNTLPINFNQLVQLLSYLKHDVSKWAILEPILGQFDEEEISVLSSMFKSNRYKLKFEKASEE